MIQTGPRWLLTERGPDGFNHLRGVEIHPNLLGKLIEEMRVLDYETVDDAV